LLEVIKGPANLQAYLDDLDMHDMAIGNTGREVDADSLKKDNNWTTPVEMNRLLSVAYSGDYLSVKNHDFLWDKMTETVIAPARLKGLLPRGTKVAHSSGTGYGSYNDVGIIFLPKGKHLVVSVFIADAQDTPERCDAAIAKIAKLAWDYYSRH
jgi:beta-lactamase class A